MARWAPRLALLRRSLERFRTPAISVIMPVYNVEAYVGECLDSVLGQDFTSFELIAVDDGSTDGSAAVVERYAVGDRRVRLLRQGNSGQGPARNRAIRTARGRFLVFVDADDLVPPGSFRFLVAALRRSGSDFAVAGVRRLDGGRRYRPSWTVAMLEHDRVGITLDDFPAAMADVVAHHRIFTRRFWTENIGGFAPGAYEDHAPMVAAYLRARRFDLLTRVVYEWRLRDDRTSTGQQKHALANLLQRISVKATTRRMVEEEGSPAAWAAWLGRVLDIDLPPYIDHALRGDAEYRSTLADVLSTYSGLGTGASLSYVRVQQKVRTWLAARGSWSDLETAQRHFRELGSIPPTVVHDGRIFIDDRLVGGISTPIPPERAELGRSESRLQVCVLRAEWVGPARLRLTGWAVIRGIDLTRRQPRLSLRLEAADGSAMRELSAEPTHVPEATRWVNWAHGRFDDAGFRTTIDMADLARDADAPRDWRLRVRVEVDGVVREGGVHHSVAGSSGSRGAISPEPSARGRRLVVPHYDGEHGLTISLRRHRDVSRPPVAATELEVTGVVARADELLVRGRATRHGRSFRLSSDDVQVEGAVHHADGGAVTIAFPLRSPANGLALPSGTWTVHAASSSRVAVFERTLAESMPAEMVTSSHRIRVAIGRGFEVRIELAAPLGADELGTRAQRLLQLAYATTDPPARAGMLVVPGPEQTHRGVSAALAKAARRAEIPPYWSVPDLATSSPGGVERVLIGSRAWYELLAAAPVLVSEGGFEDWFRKRAHQRLIRVFTGPFDASVGRSAWWAAEYTPGHIADELSRAATWDAIVIPTRSEKDRYRRELEFLGPVFAADEPADQILGELGVGR